MATPPPRKGVKPMEIILNLLAIVGLFFVGAFIGSYLRRWEQDNHWLLADELEWWKEFLRL